MKLVFNMPRKTVRMLQNKIETLWRKYFLSECNFSRENMWLFFKFPNLYTLEITTSKLKDSMKNKTFLMNYHNLPYDKHMSVYIADEKM